MSEINLKVEETEIQYTYGDQQYILSQEVVDGIAEGNELADLICADSSRAILVDGQYIVTDSPAILLQEGGDSNLTQYFLNGTTQGLVVDPEDNSANNFFENTKYVQLIEEDTSEGQQIIYYTNEDTNEAFTPVHELSEGDIEGIQDEDGNIYPLKRIKLEGQLLNFDEFIQQQNENLEEQPDADKQPSVQYTILEEDIDLKTSYMSDERTEDDDKTDCQIVDLSKITGRNLITGQTVTLHSYMEKLKSRLNKSNNTYLGRKSPKKLYSDGVNVPLSTNYRDDETQRGELDNLLDKKISIGTTKSGKKIVGKIIHVEHKKDARKTKEVVNETVEEQRDDEVKIEDQTRILVRKSSVSKESFEQISKTLGGVMEMESVRKKLENKNIVVKLVEKKYVRESDSFVKNTSYSYGYMEQELNSDVNNDVIEKWKFVPDQNTQDALLREHLNNEETNTTSLSKKTTKYPITTSLTILITYEKEGSRTIRVNLNPAPGNFCTICAQYFKTNVQLRQHINQTHNTCCEVCVQNFDNLQKLQEHRNLHVQEGKLFICNKCDKCFVTETKLQKHLPNHDLYLRPLECSVCKLRCSSEGSLKKHLLTHTGLQPFLCDICGQQFQTPYNLTFHKKTHFPENHYSCSVCMRTFSRYSNLLRHQEIHKGNGALYKCDICYCSYNYISSLTRHMVQNHLEEFMRREKNVE